MLDNLSATVSVPTTVLVGENDIPLRSFADRLHGAIRPLQFVVIPDADRTALGGAPRRLVARGPRPPRTGRRRNSRVSRIRAGRTMEWV